MEGTSQAQETCNEGTWGPFLETPDNFLGLLSSFSSSFICQLMVIIGANLAICFMKLQRLKFSFQNQYKLYTLAIWEYCAPYIAFGPGKLSGVLRNGPLELGKKGD